MVKIKAIVGIYLMFFCVLSFGAEKKINPLIFEYYFFHFEEALLSAVDVNRLLLNCIEEFPNFCKENDVFNKINSEKNYKSISKFEKLIRDRKEASEKEYENYDDAKIKINESLEALTTKTLAYELDYFSRYLAAKKSCDESTSEIEKIIGSDLRLSWGFSENSSLKITSGIFRAADNYQKKFKENGYIDSCADIVKYGQDLMFPMVKKIELDDGKKSTKFSLLGYVFGVAVVMDAKLGELN